MHPAELERSLESPEVAEVLRALDHLQTLRAGPRYPREKVLALLADHRPDRLKERALGLLLDKGQHPLEDGRVLELLVRAAPDLFARLAEQVASRAFPSAAEDTLSWCWEKRPQRPARLALLNALGRLGPKVARRYVQRHAVLGSSDPLLISAALSLLARTGAPDTRGLFERALRHENPRYRATALEYLVPRWSNPTRLQRLAPFLADPHHRIRSTAAVLAHAHRPEAAVAVLESMSHAPQPLTRAAAAWGLGEVGAGDPRCEALLRALGEDPDPRVASRARGGLGRLWRDR